MAKEKNNPAQELKEIAVNAIAKDILENGQIGTASKRYIDQIAKTSIKSTWIFNELATNLKGSGARLGKLINSVRYGWHERNVSADYDFAGMQEMGALTENILVDKYLESKIRWNTEDFSDTEAHLDQLISIVKSAILEELPIEFEKRIIQMLKGAFINGVDWNNDQGLVANQKLNVDNIDFSSEEKTKDALDTMAKRVFDIRRLDNPMFYQPDSSEYTMIISPELDWTFQKIGAYAVNGALGSYENFLGNKPTKVLLTNIRVMITPAMPKEMPAMLINKKTYYNALPNKMHARADYIGSSSTEMFQTIETGAFAFQMSYWHAKFSGIAAFFDTNAIAKGLTAYFKDMDVETGDVTCAYKLKGVSDTDASNYEVKVFDQYGTQIGNAVIPGDVSDINFEHSFNLVNQKSGTYVIEILHKTNLNNTELLYRSANYQISNKTDVRGVISEIKNEAIKQQQKELITNTSKEALDVKKPSVLNRAEAKTKEIKKD